MKLSHAKFSRQLEKDLLEQPYSRPTRVLLAEDDHDLRKVLGMVLRQEGYGVVEILDGVHLQSYLRALLYNKHRAEPVDLIVTDVRMPGPSGLEILRWLREAQWALPVLLMTAFAGPELRDEALSLGAVAVLNKPFDVRDMLALLRFHSPVE